MIYVFLSYKSMLKITRNLATKKISFINIKASRAFKIVKIFRNFPIKTSCLHNSLCEKIILSLIGIDVEVNAGLRRSSDSIEGHAWLTYNDKLIFDKKEDIKAYKYNHRIE